MTNLPTQRFNQDQNQHQRWSTPSSTGVSYIIFKFHTETFAFAESCPPLPPSAGLADGTAGWLYLGWSPESRVRADSLNTHVPEKQYAHLSMFDTGLSHTTPRSMGLWLAMRKLVLSVWTHRCSCHNVRCFSSLLQTNTLTSSVSLQKRPLQYICCFMIFIGLCCSLCPRCFLTMFSNCEPTDLVKW